MLTFGSRATNESGIPINKNCITRKTPKLKANASNAPLKERAPLKRKNKKSGVPMRKNGWKSAILKVIQIPIVHPIKAKTFTAAVLQTTNDINPLIKKKVSRELKKYSVLTQILSIVSL